MNGPDPGSQAESATRRGPRGAGRKPKACPSAAVLDRLLRSTLNEAEIEVLAAHLDTCEQCRRYVESAPEQAAWADDIRWAGGERQRTPVEVSVPLARLNELLDDYEILAEVGRGGMGVVYRARQLKLNRMVAVKVLPALLGAVRPEAATRFRREAELAARLKHTNIIAVHDYGEVDGTLFYCMELVEGRSLRDILREMKETGTVGIVVDGEAPSQTSKNPNAQKSKEGAVSSQLSPIRQDSGGGPAVAELAPTADISERSGDPSVADLHPESMTRLGSSHHSDRAYFRRIAEWIAEAAEALHYAHEQGVIHRDVKPSNLLLASDGRIMISDFGLAKATCAGTSGAVGSLTQPWSLLGTCRYMSPEQVGEDCASIDCRVDVYALGATMYELLAFRPMFAAAADREVLDHVLNKEPTPPHRLVIQVPRELETICLKAVEKDRAARYETGKDMADDLRRWLLDLPIRARRPSLPLRAVKFARRRKLPLALATTSVILLLITGMVYAAYSTTHRAASVAQADAASRGLQLLIKDAQQELEEGHLAVALDQVEDGLEQAPESLELLRLRAEIFEHAGLKEESLQALEEILERYPDDWETHYVMALGLTDRRRQGMITYFRPDSPLRRMSQEEWQRRRTYHRQQVERLKPDSAESYCLLAREQNEPARAIELLNEALKCCPTLGEALLARSKRYEQIGDYEAMLLDAERAVSMRYGWAIMHRQRGLALHALGRYGEAIRSFDDAIERDPGYAGAWHNRALAKCKLGRFAAALADANEATRLDPNMAYAYGGRARAHAGLGQLDLALADLEEVLELEPGDIEAYLERGRIYRASGRAEDSLADMTQVIRLNPNDPRGYGNRAVNYMTLKRYDRAIEDLTRWIALEPNNARAHRYRGHARTLDHEYEAAVADYSKAIELQPGVPGDLRSRADLLIDLARYEDAIADLSRLVELLPDSGARLLVRGMVYELVGATRLALADYGQAGARKGPVGDYGNLWKYTLLRLTAQNEAASELLASFRSSETNNGWTYRLFALFTDRITGDQLLAVAGTDNERAEAHYYIGLYAMLEGKTDDVVESLRQCLALNRADILETDFARARLRKLDTFSRNP